MLKNFCFLFICFIYLIFFFFDFYLSTVQSNFDNKVSVCNVAVIGDVESATIWVLIVGKKLSRKKNTFF